MNRLFPLSFVTIKDGGGDDPSGPHKVGPSLAGTFHHIFRYLRVPIRISIRIPNWGL